MALSPRPKHHNQVTPGQVGAAHECPAGTQVEPLAKKKEQFLPRVVLAQKREIKTVPKLEQDNWSEGSSWLRVGSQSPDRNSMS